MCRQHELSCPVLTAVSVTNNEQGNEKCTAAEKKEDASEKTHGISAPYTCSDIEEGAHQE
jgi:hypothetical protein